MDRTNTYHRYENMVKNAMQYQSGFVVYDISICIHAVDEWKRVINTMTIDRRLFIFLCSVIDSVYIIVDVGSGWIIQ